MVWIILLLGIAANAAASALVKSGSMGMARTVDLANTIGNGHFVLAAVFYCAAFVLFALALGRLPLNIAQPIITSGTIVVVGLVSATVFLEKFSWMQLCGYGLIVIGIALIGWERSASS